MGDSYHVRVEKSPAGEGRSTLELPFDIADVGRMLGGLARTVRGASAVRDAAPMEGAEPPPGPAEVGKQLYNALFQGEVQERFISSLARVDERGSALRIRLKMDLDEPGLADVASLPWELLYPGAEKGFLNTSESTPVIRSLDVGQPTRPYPFQPPMRILVVIANPEGSADLDLTDERAAIEASWGKLPDVEVDFLDQATVQGLREKLGEKDYHVFHFMGHGDFNRETNRGCLLFDDGKGGVQQVDSGTLQMLLRDERASLRLVFLNACKTAVAGQEHAVDPFAGVATSLIRVGIPALVAMQFPISDPAAIVFSATFYDKLVQGAPVDVAMVEARKAIRTEDISTMEWATPVLFMRSPDGVLFEHGEAKKRPPPPPPPPDEVPTKEVAKQPVTDVEAGAEVDKSIATTSKRSDAAQKERDRASEADRGKGQRPKPDPAPRRSRKGVLLAVGAVGVLGVAAAIVFWPGAPTPTGLSIDPPPASIEMGQEVDLVASLRAEGGDDIDARYLSGYDVQWASSPPGLATITGVFDSLQSRLEGRLIGQRPGQITVTASLGEDLTDSRPITVLISDEARAEALAARLAADQRFDTDATDQDVMAAYAAVTESFDYALEEPGMEGVGDRAAAVQRLLSAFDDAESANANELTIHERRDLWLTFVRQAQGVRSNSPSVATAGFRLVEIDGIGASSATLQLAPQLGSCSGDRLCTTNTVTAAVLSTTVPMAPGHVTLLVVFRTAGQSPGI